MATGQRIVGLSLVGMLWIGGGCTDTGGSPSPTAQPTPTQVPALAPAFVVEPDSLVFEDVPVGEVASATLAVSNGGGADLVVAVGVSDDGDGAFSLTGSTGPFTLQPAEEVTLTVEFAPERGGDHEGSLTFATNDRNFESHVLELRGGAVASTTPEPTLPPTLAPTEPPDLTPALGTPSPTPSVDTPTPQADEDEDGYSVALDCDDTRADVYPGAPEQCNGVDDNCDAAVDEGVWVPVYTDADGDGFGEDSTFAQGCVVGEGQADVGGDCDDNATGVYPGAPEYCDGVDNDCDDELDEGDAIDAQPIYPDQDADGYGVEEGEVQACAPPEGYASRPGDCDDADPAFNPGAAEQDCSDDNDYNCDGSVAFADNDGDGFPACQECNDASSAAYPGGEERCDGIDNNCDGATDEGVTQIFYQDADADGHGTDALTQQGCEAPDGFSDLGDDCDDSAPSAWPGATERCDGIDNNCDGQIDEAGAEGERPFYPDGDGDTFGVEQGQQVGCDAPEGFSPQFGDCNDADPAYYPGAPEACSDTQDYNCDGSVAYADQDADGVPACQDCDDTNADARPGGVEVCDGADNNCNGSIDEGVTSPFYSDRDGDGFGAGTASQACDAPTGSVSNNLDCNDADPEVNPVAVESCNNKDDNCNNTIDETNAEGCTVLYVDADGDSWGTTDSTCQCSTRLGYATRSGDCNDGSSAINPGAAEKCDQVDNDCDLASDEPGAQGCSRFYKDADKDTWGVNGDYQCLCEEEGDYSATTGNDCLDTDGGVYPGAAEVCDNKDNNCNGQSDEGVKTTWYVDADNDGYGALYNSKEACTQPTGYVAQGGDCNDFSATIKPGAPELCDAIDNNCNGAADEGLPQVNVYVDLDGDGHGATNSSPRKTCLIDQDGDGTGESAPSGYALSSDDCNDSDVTVYTGATETCDGKDNDCDTVVDRLCFSACEGDWPFKMDHNLGAPIAKLADLNGDGNFEVVVQDSFGFAILDHEGLPLYNYSAPVHNYSRNYAVLADIDTYDSFGAGAQDLEVLTGNGSYPIFYKLASNSSVTPWTNTSSGNYYLYDASRFIATDLDFDARPEFVTTSWCDPAAAVKFYRFDKGTSTIGWVKNIADPTSDCHYTDGRTFTDLNGDGIAELVMGNGYSYATDPSVWGGYIYAYKFTDPAAPTQDFYCPAGTCFKTDIPGLYGGSVADLYRVGNELRATVYYYTTNTSGQSNASTVRYWAFNLDGTVKTGYPATSVSGWYPTDVDGDGTVESFSDLIDMGLWDVNGDGFADQLWASGSQLRVSLWDNSKKQMVEHTPSRLSVSSASVGIRSAWDMDADGRINVTSADTNGNVYCHQLGPNTFNRGSSLPPHAPWYQRTYQWDNYEPNEGQDTNGDGLPDRVIRVASALTRKGNFYSYLSSASDKDFFVIDAGYSGPICLQAPRGKIYRLSVYSYTDRWNNSTQQSGADGKPDGLIWQSSTSSGGQVCYYTTSTLPYRQGEYKFAIAVDSGGDFSAWYPYWISAPK